jgi:hypothetical protein
MISPSFAPLLPASRRASAVGRERHHQGGGLMSPAISSPTLPAPASHVSVVLRAMLCNPVQRRAFSSTTSAQSHLPTPPQVTSISPHPHPAISLAHIYLHSVLNTFERFKALRIFTAHHPAAPTPYLRSIYIFPFLRSVSHRAQLLSSTQTFSRTLSQFLPPPHPSYCFPPPPLLITINTTEALCAPSSS